MSWNQHECQVSLLSDWCTAWCFFWTFFAAEKKTQVVQQILRYMNLELKKQGREVSIEWQSSEILKSLAKFTIDSASCWLSMRDVGLHYWSSGFSQKMNISNLDCRSTDKKTTGRPCGFHLLTLWICLKGRRQTGPTTSKKFLTRNICWCFDWQWNNLLDLTKVYLVLKL